MITLEIPQKLVSSLDVEWAWDQLQVHGKVVFKTELRHIQTLKMHIHRTKGAYLRMKSVMFDDELKPTAWACWVETEKRQYRRKL